MIRKCQILFCGNEHGIGDVTFPDVDMMDGHSVKQIFLEAHTVGTLRKAAKAEGWGRINGEDYCPACMESEGRTAAREARQRGEGA
jgi:hypothetical protein